MAGGYAGTTKRGIPEQQHGRCEGVCQQPSHQEFLLVIACAAERFAFGCFPRLALQSRTDGYSIRWVLLSCCL